MAAWRQLGENCQKYLAKGRKVAVVGPVSVRMYQAQDGTTKASMEVQAIDVEFLSSAKDSADSTPAETAPATSAVPEGFTPAAIPDDQLPF